MEDLLAMHVIHPNKIAHSAVALHFGLTLNQPIVAMENYNFNTTTGNHSVGVGAGDLPAFSFWCTT